MEAIYAGNLDGVLIVEEDHIPGASCSFCHLRSENFLLIRVLATTTYDPENLHEHLSVITEHLDHALKIEVTHSTVTFTGRKFFSELHTRACA